jgi:RNA polymerase sigma factor (sigma-70 family)
MMQTPVPSVSAARAVWLARNALPHEGALRRWLARNQKIVNLEIDDIVQETYAILVGLQSVEHIEKPQSYMFSVAQSVVLQHIRRARIISIEAVAEIERFDHLRMQSSPEQQVSDREELRVAAERIAKLPARCRQAFILRKVEGLSQKEVALRMSVSENTVEKHMGKAIRILMDALGHASDPHQANAGQSSSRDSLINGKNRF